MCVFNMCSHFSLMISAHFYFFCLRVLYFSSHLNQFHSILLARSHSSRIRRAFFLGIHSHNENVIDFSMLFTFCIHICHSYLRIIFQVHLLLGIGYWNRSAGMRTICMDANEGKQFLQFKLCVGKYMISITDT